uniref:Uncharacterized protein n=1 Tax=Panagrolaimus sp. PS1159 TaxID=55785 RepID=A0AC35F8S6_9BILA
MIKQLLNPAQKFSSKIFQSKFNPIKTKFKKKDSISSNLKPETIILNPRSKFPNLPLSLNSVQKHGGKRLDRCIIFTFTTFSCFLTYMMLKNQNTNGTPLEVLEDVHKIPEDVHESIADTSIMADLDILKDKNFHDYLLQSVSIVGTPIMADLDILKDKNFHDYLLQSLTDHYGKLLGYENVTMRPEFTKEFFASYWMSLMKSVGYDNVPPVTLEDHQHHGKLTNGFDTIVRSLFGVCESRIDLRVTTLFAFSGKELG